MKFLFGAMLITGLAVLVNFCVILIFEGQRDRPIQEHRDNRKNLNESLYVALAITAVVTFSLVYLIHSLTP